MKPFFSFPFFLSIKFSIEARQQLSPPLDDLFPHSPLFEEPSSVKKYAISSEKKAISSEKKAISSQKKASANIVSTREENKTT